MKNIFESVEGSSKSKRKELKKDKSKTIITKKD